MKPAMPMEVETALKFMSIEKAIELENKRFFCNADETVNTISIWAMKKQIPQKPLPEPRYYGVGKCPNCNAVFLDNSTNYCGNCGQALDWGKKEVAELCPYCQYENVLEWDIEKDGYEVTCRKCKRKIMLCSECLNAQDKRPDAAIGLKKQAVLESRKELNNNE